MKGPYVIFPDGKPPDGFEYINDLEVVCACGLLYTVAMDAFFLSQAEEHLGFINYTAKEQCT
jgi:hypothetical protein